MQALARQAYGGTRLDFNTASPKSKASPALSVSSAVSAMASVPSSSSSTATAPTAFSSTDGKVPVYLRIKPTLSSNKSEDSIIPLENDTKVRTGLGKQSQEYTFTKVFSSTATQQQVFEEVAGPTLDQFLRQRRDGLIFAYGVTNSGKTFTVQGTRDCPGIIPQVLDRIFTENTAGVLVSYLQIYNDQIQDLQDFTPPLTNYSTGMESRRNLKVKVREDSVLVEGLKETPIASAQQGMVILERGNRELRTNQDNGLNSNSSRSHTVFIVRLGEAKLHIVDLAGSERAKRTKLTSQRQLEASSINSSLSHLMGCLQAMRSNQRLAKLYPGKPQNKPPFRPIPFRECKLTLLFRDCLKASQGVVMIVNASPDPLDFEETQHALRYGEMTRSTALMADVSNTYGNGSSSSSNFGGKTEGGGSKLYGYDGRRRVAGARRPLHQISQPTAPPTQQLTSQTPKPERIKCLASSPISKSASKVKLSFVRSQPLSPAQQVPFFFAREEAPPATPQQTQSLEEENYELQRELGELQRKLVKMEADLRQELSKEMDKQVQEMEQRFRTRLERNQSLEREESQLIRSQTNAHNADLKVLADQVVECEDEMNRMRESHLREMEALQRELNQALRNNQHPPSVSSQSTTEISRLVLEEREKSRKLAKELEEYKLRANELEKELQDEMDAHSMVITDRCQVSDELDSALEREEELKAKLETLLIASSSRPTHVPFQLSGSAPNLLLSKRKPPPTKLIAVRGDEENVA
ncbi:hypothetical protein BASA81_005544 [Batrachochytrium salamandrivorans]|nr:hypothetical protein BASA81_005544 [Batrachochytrium salamandrivorans]